MKRFLKSLVVLPVMGVFEALTPESMRRGGSPIVPPRSVAGRSMVAVIAIMSFLACLTTGAVYLINQSANAWFQDIASEVTVQVSPIDGADMEQRLTQITFFLARQKGLVNIRPLSDSESGNLLEPWLGEGYKALKALPVPRLIAVEIDRSSPPNLAQVRQALRRKFKGVLLDDHGHWQAQIRTVTNSLALGGIAVLFLVAIATIAIVISAARSSMSSNRDIVEVLNFVGARHSFIVHEFDRHFLVLGIRAGLLGAAAAAAVFFLMPTVMQLLGGGSVTATELRRLVGPAALDVQGYVMLLAVVLVVAAICMLTSHYWVDHILNFEARKARRSNSGAGMFGRLAADPDMRTPEKPERRRTPRAERELLFDMGRWLKSSAKAAAAAVILAVLGFFAFAFSIDSTQPSTTARADGIVVLTGGGKRIEEALSLLSRGRASRLLISGVHPGTTRGILSRLMPANEQMFACCVDIDRQALNTVGNATETRSWTRQRGFRSLIVVTSSYHMPRSLVELKRAMPDIRLIPHPVVPPRFAGSMWWLKPQNIRVVTFEYLKFLPAIARLGGTRLQSFASQISGGKFQANAGGTGQ